jgi:hypothetical protein
MMDLNTKRQQAAALLVSDRPRDHRRARRLHAEIIRGHKEQQAVLLICDEGVMLAPYPYRDISLGEVFFVCFLAIAVLLFGLTVVFGVIALLVKLLG